MRKPRNLIIAGMAAILALAITGCKKGDWADVQSAQGGEWIYEMIAYQSSTYETVMLDEECETLSKDSEKLFTDTGCLCYLECRVLPETCEPVSTGVSSLDKVDTWDPSNTEDTTYFSPLFPPPQLPDLAVLEPDVSVKDSLVYVSTRYLENCSDVEDPNIDYEMECEIWEHTYVYSFTFDTRSRCTVEITERAWLGQETARGTGTDIDAEYSAEICDGQGLDCEFTGWVTLTADNRTFVYGTHDRNLYVDLIKNPKRYKARVDEEGIVHDLKEK